MVRNPPQKGNHPSPAQTAPLCPYEATWIAPLGCRLV